MYLGFIALYIVIITLIGLASAGKIKGVSDFFLGGRSVNPWMSAFSYGTAYFSAVLFIGYAGKTGWSFGLSALWVVVGNTLIGSFLAWHILGKRTREMTTRLGASTMPDFIGIRYQSKGLKIVSALIIFIFLVPYSASVYKGLSFLFDEVFGIPNIVVLSIIAISTALYLVLGGFVASTMADFIQGIIMIIGVILMLIFLLSYPDVGGVRSTYHTLKAIDPELVKPIGPQGLGPTLSLVLLTSLGSWGLPQMVHKFYTIRDEESIKSAKWVSTGFALLITFGAYFTGVTSRVFFPDSMPMSQGVPNPDIIMPRVLLKTLPEPVLGIILILVLSASMSTLASLVLASSSAIALDLIQGIWKPDIDSKQLMGIMRFLCLLFVAFSFLIAVLPNPIMTLASLSWGAVSGSLLAPYIYGLFWQRTTKWGVWASIFSALGIVIGGAIFTGMDEAMMPLFSALAIVLPLVILPVVSLLSEPFEAKHLEKIYHGVEL